MSLILKNGQVVLEDRTVKTDIRMEGERITALGEMMVGAGDQVVDAAGRWVLPGFIDVHTHLDDRIGAYPLADDYRSGTRCAITNGVTTLAAFVTETADVRLDAAVHIAAQKASGKCFCDHWWHLTPIRYDTSGWNTIRALVKRGFRSWKLYTTYRDAGLYLDYDRISRVFEGFMEDHVRFLVHCEDETTLAAVHLTDDEWCRATAHAHSRPAAAEVIAVREVLKRAEAAHVRVHIVHVSTHEAADLIDAARGRVEVTCETAPHYLFLDESELARPDGHRWICSPPLRPKPVREALVHKALGGSMDLFATDHCAFLRGDKDTLDNGMRAIPKGLAGIGALPHMIRALYADQLPERICDFAQRLSTNPARLLGVYPRKGAIAAGADADLAVVSLDGPVRPVRSSLAEVHETYPGFTSRLFFDHVFLRGEHVVCGGRLVDTDHPRGRSLWPI
jgi:dihydropyrimidinase